ncbi:MAG: hypothetical protein WC897_02555 [Candidatus Gracilibacteria bacterium]
MKKLTAILVILFTFVALNGCKKDGATQVDDNGWATDRGATVFGDANITFENTQTDDSYVISVLMDGEKIADLNQTWPADGYDVSIFESQEDAVYIAVNPTGLGGFILYTGAQNLYRVDLVTTSVEKLNFEGFATDISDDGASLVSFYQDETGLKVGVYDLSKNSPELPNLPTKKVYTVSSDFFQAGEGLFSPDGKYLAYASTMAPADMGYETANTTNDLITAIFVIDLTKGTQVEFAREDYMVNIEGWSYGNPVYEVEKDAK